MNIRRQIWLVEARHPDTGRWGYTYEPRLHNLICSYRTRADARAAAKHIRQFSSLITRVVRATLEMPT